VNQIKQSPRRYLEEHGLKSLAKPKHKNSAASIVRDYESFFAREIQAERLNQANAVADYDRIKEVEQSDEGY
jgi:hypothetical protein